MMKRVSLSCLVFLLLAGPAGAVLDDRLDDFFGSVGELNEAPAEYERDGKVRKLEGSLVRVEGVLVADFFRDIYLCDPEPGLGHGLRVVAREHLSEVGQRVQCEGVIRREEGELFLDASRTSGRIKPFGDEAVRRPEPLFVGAEDLLAEPELYRAQLIQLGPVRVLGFRRDGNAVPWLVRVEVGKHEIGVLIQDGQHPVLHEGMDLRGIRGIWQRRGEHWNLRPRFSDDFLALDAGDFRGDEPPARELWERGRKLFRNRVGPGDPIQFRPHGPLPLLDEICHDPWGPGDGEGAESFAVLNAGNRELDLAGWSVTDNEGEWSFPAGARLAPGGRLRVARDDERYFFEFGLMPDYSFDEHPSPEDSALVLDNDGDELLLVDPDGRVADAVVFENGWADAQPGWSGAALRPFRFNAFVPEEGQVFWRKAPPDGSTTPPDSNRDSDWICDPSDPLLGQGVAFPGWDLAAFREPASCLEEAELTAFVSPDNSLAGVLGFLRSATESLELSLYLFTHPLVAEELHAAMDRSVRVAVLLNGEVFGARGGTYDSVRGIARSIAGHPSGLGRVYLWRNGDDPRHLGPDADIPDRYNHPHQKFILADRRRVLVGSDNLTQSSLPADDFANGTAGSRGVFLATDASCIVERAVAIWEADCDPRRQRDIRRYVPREDLAERMPRLGGDRRGYEPVQAEPFTTRENAGFVLNHSPENYLHPRLGYLGLANRAGAGDWLLVEQQYERAHWGYGDAQTPNPRWEAYLEAARRGASVRVILNGAGGRERQVKNTHACRRINNLARDEGVDLFVGMASLPDARKSREGAIHNKMILARIGGECWSHVGSANGSETAHRFNRELGLSIESRALFEYLAEVFRADWNRAGLHGAPTMMIEKNKGRWTGLPAAW